MHQAQARRPSRILVPQDWKARRLNVLLPPCLVFAVEAGLPLSAAVGGRRRRRNEVAAAVGSFRSLGYVWVDSRLSLATVVPDLLDFHAWTPPS